MIDRESFLERWLRILRRKLAAKSREVDDPAEAMDRLLENQMAAITQGAATWSSWAPRRNGCSRWSTNMASELSVAAGNRDLARTSLRRSIECAQLIKEGRAHLADVS
jgi:hypothetical protein